MWAKSKPNEYTSFRTFIMGITSQSMFPDGVIYEGVSEEPLSFRGESGANDSMIPLLDNLLTLSLPSTPLTTILTDFRSYRPGNHRQFLAWVSAQSLQLDLKSFALDPTHPSSNLWYLRALDQVREFRWRHWCFTREYILKRTSHPTATGGSPIVRWLPNQLTAVLDGMCDVGRVLGVQTEDEEVDAILSRVAKMDVGEKVNGHTANEYKANGTNGKTTGANGHAQRETLEKRELQEAQDIMEVVSKQKRELAREVKKWCEERGEKV